MMKKWLCLLLVLLPMPVFADVANLTFYENAEAEKQGALARIGFVIWTMDYSDWSIECFDVREDGMIALGFNRSPEMKYVAVLDADGVFQYGCTFKIFLCNCIRKLRTGLCNTRFALHFRTGCNRNTSGIRDLSVQFFNGLAQMFAKNLITFRTSDNAHFGNHIPCSSATGTALILRI